jgi:hypothetical protein
VTPHHAAVLRLPRVFLALSLLGAIACTPAATPASAAPVAHRPAAPVVVTLVVDQLAAWVARERLEQLPSGGGFARLRTEGEWVHALRYEHAVTDTAPGHAALYTGAVPAVSGVFANEVLDAEGKPSSVLRDPHARVLTSDGSVDRPGSSLARYHVETLADRLRAEHPDAVIVSLSLKDRGALPGGGRNPTASLWLDLKDNRFVSSTAVARTFPVWAGAPLAEALRRAEGQTWTLLDASWVGTHALTVDAEAGEGEIPGYGIVFPHALGAAKQAPLAFRTSPFADDVLLDLGLAALDAEGGGKHETLLAISLSANDYIGHTFGPDSWEAWDELARLDQALARFFRGLDARFGADGYAVVLAADHGTTPMPEAGRHGYCDAGADKKADPWSRACGVARRVFPEELAHTLAASARKAVGAGDWVLGVSDPYVDLTAAARALEPARRAALDAALLATLKAYPGVAAVYDVRSIPASCPPFSDESRDALVCRSVVTGDRAVQPELGDLYVVLEPGSFFDPTIVVGKGTSHGSPYFYDRTVPLLVRAPGRVVAGAVLETTTFNAFADTAAALLGIAPPHDAVPGASLASAQVR